MDKSVDVVNLVSTLLDSGKYKEALSVPRQEKLKNICKDKCWDLIAVVIGKVHDDTITIKPSLYGACEELLEIITQISSPEEALLELIEQVELAKNEAQLNIILSPLQQVLQKLPTKKGRSLEWCLNSISTYIENIPTPEHNLEGEERLLLDADMNVRRITRVYTLLPSFYRTFMNTDLDESTARINQVISAFLISLLGKPVIYIDLDPQFNAASEARKCCATIIEDICILEKNVLKLLTYLEICYKENKKPKSAMSNKETDELSPYEHKEKVNMTTLSGLLYIVYSGHFELSATAVPQVYSNEYIVHTVMLAVNHLLTFTEYGPLQKATCLFESILNRLDKNSPSTLLSSSIHFETLKSLLNVCIYSTYENIRKKALILIGIHVKKFDTAGSCLIIKFLIEISNHSGMIGYAISMYKDTIKEAFELFDKFNSNGECPTWPECFSGAPLMNMVKKICHLPHGAESDLMELADQIFGALNFLRYLILKDTKNITGIRDNFSTIEIDYLDKLRTGLYMSKAHYEVKLKDIQEGKEPAEEVSINVGGNILNEIPTEKKVEIIQSALNAFHLMECLLARLSECFNLKLQE